MDQDKQERSANCLVFGHFSALKKRKELCFVEFCGTEVVICANQKLCQSAAL